MSDNRPSWEKFTAKEWALALQDLTPGGSEFLTPRECADYVRERTNYPQIIIRQREQIKELQAALRAMLEAYASRADWSKPRELHAAVYVAGKALGKL